MNTSQLSTQPTKGFRDFYPDEMAIRQWLFDHMKAAARSFGYQMYDGPLVEPVSLYEAKSSKELVEQQTFQLTDRGNRQVALRPEMTPSLARMIAQKQQQLGTPLRWFNIGPRFRYEAPQRGRAREFYQWDCDLIGPKTPEADAEIIAIACEFFNRIGLSADDVVIKVNNRKLLESKLSSAGFKSEQFSSLIPWIDRRDKLSREKWHTALKSEGISKKHIEELELLLSDTDVSYESEELTQLFSTLTDMGYADYVKYDPSIVRGLDYYTGTVFEAQDRQGKLRAVLGGGRYDNLVELFGAKPSSGIGFACGDMVIMELLKDTKKIPDLNTSPTQILITIFNESATRYALKTARMLRYAGIATELYPDPTTKLDKQLKYAHKTGIPLAIIAGPDEQAQNQVAVKNMKTKQQKTLSQKELIEYIKKHLTPRP
jgi:histidyl-tRNA synthetase